MRIPDDLKRKLTDAGLGGAAPRIAQLARPCYRISRVLAPEPEIPIGASKFGGSPDVPAGFVWPPVPEIKESEAMEFVGQVCLADLPEPPAAPVPRHGLLSFFTHWCQGRVFYFPEGTSLQRIEVPNAPAKPAPAGLWQNLRATFRRKTDLRQTYRSGLLTFEAELSPPDGNSSMIQQLNLSAADRETYIELCETSWASHPAGTLKHQMFGHASPVQNEMELECDFLRVGENVRWDLPCERFVSAAGDWVLLLQVDSDDAATGPGWMWGDLGMVYFWIHRDDLGAQAFDRVIAIEQCH